MIAGNRLARAAIRESRFDKDVTQWARNGFAPEIPHLQKMSPRTWVLAGEALLAASELQKMSQPQVADASGKPAPNQLVDKASVAWPSDAVPVPTEVFGADGSYSKRLDLA